MLKGVSEVEHYETQDSGSSDAHLLGSDEKARQIQEVLTGLQEFVREGAGRKLGLSFTDAESIQWKDRKHEQNWHQPAKVGIILSYFGLTLSINAMDFVLLLNGLAQLGAAAFSLFGLLSLSARTLTYNLNTNELLVNPVFGEKRRFKVTGFDSKRESREGMTEIDLNDPYDSDDSFFRVKNTVKVETSDSMTELYARVSSGRSSVLLCREKVSSGYGVMDALIQTLISGGHDLSLAVRRYGDYLEDLHQLKV